MSICLVICWLIDSLKGNRLSVESFKLDGRHLGLLSLTNLVSLDLSNNPLELSSAPNRSIVFGVMKGLPRLTSLGLAGTWDDPSKPLTREQRCVYIRSLPTLRNPLAQLRYAPPSYLAIHRACNRI